MSEHENNNNNGANLPDFNAIAKLPASRQRRLKKIGVTQKCDSRPSELIPVTVSILDQLTRRISLPWLLCTMATDEDVVSVFRSTNLDDDDEDAEVTRLTLVGRDISGAVRCVPGVENITVEVYDLVVTFGAVFQWDNLEPEILLAISSAASIAEDDLVIDHECLDGNDDAEVTDDSSQTSDRDSGIPPAA